MLGRFLVVSTSDNLIFAPTSQFKRTAHGWREWPDVQAVLLQLRAHDGWSVGLLLKMPAPELGGLSILEALEAGQTDAVRAVRWPSPRRVVARRRATRRNRR